MKWGGLIGHALQKRYGHSSHPLFPRLVMYLKKNSPTHFVVEGKLQKHYGGAWHTVVSNDYTSVQQARGAYHVVGDATAIENNVPDSHVEYT